MGYLRWGRGDNATGIQPIDFGKVGVCNKPRTGQASSHLSPLRSFLSSSVFFPALPFFAFSTLLFFFFFFFFLPVGEHVFEPIRGR